MKYLLFALLTISTFAGCKKSESSTLSISVTRPTDNQVINFGGSLTRQYWIEGTVQGNKALTKVTLVIKNAAGVVISETIEDDFQGEASWSFSFNSYMTTGATSENLTFTATATDASGATVQKVVAYRLVG